MSDQLVGREWAAKQVRGNALNRTVLIGLWGWAVLAVAGTATVWANNPPVVTNVTSSQRTDGSKLVDIFYDLADADGDACTVMLQASDDGGATWTTPITAVTGAVGSGVTPGSGKHVIWNSNGDLPGAFGSQYKVRVCANDSPPPEMVFIPGGEFEMGDSFAESRPDELPVHTVYLSPYYIDKYEVTNQQYATALNWAYSQGGLITVTGGVVYQTGTSYAYCATTTSFWGMFGPITWNGSTFGVTAGKEDHPMMVVTWYGSAAFCNWRSAMEGKPLCYDLSTWACNFGVNGYRLPTEAEWEKAAAWDPAQNRHFRFSEHTDGCGNNCLDGQRANYWPSGDPFESGSIPLTTSGTPPLTTPIGYYDGTTHGNYSTQNAQSYYGCYDMSGNVWEWVNDWYGSNYYSDPEATQPDPDGPASGPYRVLRGGNWAYGPDVCRSAYRDRDVPDYGDVRFGFRCALGTS